MAQTKLITQHKAKQLAVVFSSKPKSGDQFDFQQELSAMPSHLLLCKPSNNLAYLDDLEVMGEALTHAVRETNAKQITFIGEGIGGFAALMFGFLHRKPCRILSFSPYFSLNSYFEDQKIRQERMPKLEDLWQFAESKHTKTTATIISGGFAPQHAEAYCRFYETPIDNTSLWLCASHAPLRDWLKHQRALKAIYAAFFADETIRMGDSLLLPQQDKVLLPKLVALHQHVVHNDVQAEMQAVETPFIEADEGASLNPLFFHLRSLVAAQQENDEQAEELNSRALQLWRKQEGWANASLVSFRLLQHQTKLMKKRGKGHEALHLIFSMLKEHEKDPWSHFVAGKILADIAPAAYAETAFQQAIHYSPNMALFHFEMGKLYDGENRLTKAEEHFLVALNENPDNPQFQYHLAALQLRQNRVDDAMQLISSALKSDPKNPAYLFQKAIIANKIGEYAEAKTLIQALLVEKPQHPPYLFQFGITHCHLGDQKSGIGYMEEAIAKEERSSWRRQLDEIQNKVDWSIA